MTDSKSIQKLFLARLMGELSADQEKELTRWRGLSPDHETLFRESVDWEKTSRRLRLMMDNKDKVFSQIKLNYPLGKSPYQGYDRAEKIRRRIAIFAVAAMVLVALLVQILVPKQTQIQPGKQKAYLIDPATEGMGDPVAGLMYTADQFESREVGDKEALIARNQPEAPDTAMIKLATRGANEFGLILPRVLHAWLNSWTSIDFPAFYDKKTVHIFISGEAYVSSEREIPIEFHVGQMHLQGERARFNVKSYPGEGTRLTMLSGHLQWWNDSATMDPSHKLDLAAGQEIFYQDGKWVLTTVDTSQAIAWKNGRIFYHQADIKTIMRDLSRWYNVKFEFSGKIPDKPFSLDFPRNAPFADILKKLGGQGLHYQLSGDEMTILP